MKIRIEEKPTFYVSGYAVETSEETLERDCALMREKYEDKLRTLSNHLYFVAYMSETEKMVYHFGAKVPSLEPVLEGATCIEVPATTFAVATVSKDTPILTTWYQFFELFEKEEVPENVKIDLEFKYHCESFDENKLAELWIPVIK